jgi:hypothetical protein
MIGRRDRSLPTPKDGSKRLVNSYLYRMLRAAETIDTPVVFTFTRSRGGQT